MIITLHLYKGGIQMYRRKLAKVLGTALIITAFLGNTAGFKAAAADQYKFDFGNGGVQRAILV
jgi:hypothetical protein